MQKKLRALKPALSTVDMWAGTSPAVGSAGLEAHYESFRDAGGYALAVQCTRIRPMSISRVPTAADGTQVVFVPRCLPPLGACAPSGGGACPFLPAQVDFAATAGRSPGGARSPANCGKNRL